MPLVSLRKTHYSLPAKRKRVRLARLAGRKASGPESNAGFFTVRIGRRKTARVPFKIHVEDAKALRAVIVTPGKKVLRIYESIGRHNLSVYNESGHCEGNLTYSLGNRKIWESATVAKRGQGIGTILLKAMEHVYWEQGRQKMTAAVEQASSMNFFLKGGFRPADQQSADFVRRYLRAKDKSGFRESKNPDDLTDPNPGAKAFWPSIRLEKTVRAGMAVKGKHAILVAGLFGRPKWHFIPKELLESQAQAL
ncbi:MAG: GNAT family N-acetyltransferase [Candidatus Diapherotrites archaeon]